MRALLRQRPSPWLWSAVLAAAMTLLLLIEQSLLGIHGERIRTLTFLPVLLSLLWCTPLQVRLLAGLSLALFLTGLSRQAALMDPLSIARILSRLVGLSLCLGIAEIRQRNRRQCQQLAERATELAERSRDLALQVKLSRQACSLAHEIRQPLSAIQIHTRRLLQRLTHLKRSDPATFDSVEALDTATSELNHCIRSMADLLRSGRSEQRTIDLTDVIVSAIEALSQQLSAAGISLTSEGLEQPLWLIGDAGQLRMACINLIRNAAEAVAAMPSGSRHLQVALEQRGEQICLRVADSGPGLGKPLASMLEQGGSSGRGMGLGLQIVEAIAQQHQGWLEAGRCNGLGGAELRLMLPCPR